MGENSKIEWTHHTWNPWRGCEHATLPDGTPHPGCLHCYAERGAKRNPAVMGRWGSASEGGTRVVAVDKTFNAPKTWNDLALAADRTDLVFVDSYSDFFEDWQEEVLCHDETAHYTRDGDPTDVATNAQARGYDMDAYHHTTLADVRSRAFGIIDQCGNLVFQLLTKRPQNVRRMWPASNCPECAGRGVGKCPACKRNGPDNGFRRNTWLLASVSDQATVDALAPELLKCDDLFPVLGLSIEPLLGPIDLTAYLPHYVCTCGWRSVVDPWPRQERHTGSIRCPRCEGFDTDFVFRAVDWVIVGGESGPRARPMHPDWVRSIRDQCEGAGVPFFFKQWGEWLPMDEYSPFKHGVDNDRYAHRFLYRDGTTHPKSGCSDLPTSMFRVGKKAAGRMLDGRTWDQMPEVATA